MGENNAQVRRYLREIRSWLPCSRRKKGQILKKIRDTVMDFLAENPSASYTEITDRFGSPQQIASSYVNEMGMGELLRDLRIRRKLVRIASITAVVVLVLWASVVTLAYIDYLDDTNGYIVETITVVEQIP